MNKKKLIMEALIVVGLGLAIGFSPIGKIPAVRIIVQVITGGWVNNIPSLIAKKAPFIGPVSCNRLL